MSLAYFPRHQEPGKKFYEDPLGAAKSCVNICESSHEGKGARRKKVWMLRIKSLSRRRNQECCYHGDSLLPTSVTQPIWERDGIEPGARSDSLDGNLPGKTQTRRVTAQTSEQGKHQVPETLVLF